MLINRHDMSTPALTFDATGIRHAPISGRAGSRRRQNYIAAFLAGKNSPCA
jgi:hypothetical protein